MTNRLLSTLGGTALAAALALAASSLLGLAPARAANPRSATVQKVLPSAVRIQIAAAGEVVRSAAGVAFARDAGETFVLTNAHVVDPSPSWKQPVELRVLASGRARVLLARLVARGRVPDQDLAVIAVTDSTLPLVRLAADDAPELGDDLVVVGAPYGKGLSVAAGIVSQVEYEHAESAAGPRVPQLLKTDAAIGYGSSGGGIFEVPTGRLIGLVEGYRTARVTFGKEEGYAFDVPMPGETFAAPAAKIRRFLAERGLARLAPGGGASAGAASASAVAAPVGASSRVGM